MLFKFLKISCIPLKTSNFLVLCFSRNRLSDKDFFISSMESKKFKFYFSIEQRFLEKVLYFYLLIYLFFLHLFGVIKL